MLGHFISSQQRGQDVQKGPSSKAAGTLAGGAYEGVREHDKGPRTPLADFFNTLLVVVVCLLMFTQASWGQEVSANQTPPTQTEKVLKIQDLPALEPEIQRDEARQEEAKGRALQAFRFGEEITAIPLPVASFNRNEKAFYGLIVPIFIPNRKGHLEDIVAPQYLHNKRIKETFTINYFGYPSDTTQYRAKLSYSTKIQREIDLAYKNVGAGGGRYILMGRFSWFKDPFRRFFGIGSSTEESDETNYTSKETLADFTAGIHLAQDIALMWSERFRQVRLQKGVVRSLPQIEEDFPDIDGIDGAQIIGHKLTLRFDLRDKQLITTRGLYLNISGEWNQNIEPHAKTNWWRTTIDGRYLIPHLNNKLVFIFHLYADAVRGGSPPFYERPSLGGQNSLRAFGESRFIDDTALVLNLEERIPLHQQTVLGYDLDFELAPFLDIGRVGSHFSTNMLLKPQVNPGVGFRFMNRPHVVGRVDVAYGSDGVNFFAGLDYPF